jgi:NAD(P)H-hydrate epimerase
VAGCKDYAGAAVLTGNGAIQCGTGIVTVVTSESAQEAVSKRVLPEVIVRSVAETEKGAMSLDAFDSIKSLCEKADVLAIGSGLSSNEETTRKLVREIIEKRTTPIVIDADGLNSVSPFELQGSDDLPLILTPHEGEFLRLLGTDDKHAIKDRVKVARDFAVKHNVILVLKGERTLLAEPGGKVVINSNGNSGLGKAGNGDNLAGIITGFIAQGMKCGVGIFESVVAAVYISGLAGDIAMRKFGKRVMIASDVRDCLTEGFREVGGDNE